MSVHSSRQGDNGEKRSDVDDVTYERSESGACRSAPVGRGRCRTKVPLGPEATLETCFHTNKFVKQGGDYDAAVGRPPHPKVPATRASQAGIGFTVVCDCRKT